MPNIIYSSLITPDGTTLVSHSSHSYVSHTDANGKYYFLDGGSSYIRHSNNSDEKLVTICDDEPHSIIREWLHWGTYGKNGDQPLRYLKLSEINDEHLYTLVTSYLSSNHKWYHHFENELNYRAGIYEDLS